MGCLLASGVEAFRSRNPHPFQGEHQDADYIEHEDRTTHRAMPFSLNLNKYAALADLTDYTPQKDPATQLWEYVFGLSEEETLFKENLEDYISSQTRRGRKRLGAIQTTVEDVSDNPDVFAAKIYPGQSTPLYAFLDTTTRAIGIGKSFYNITASLNKSTIVNGTKIFQATLGKNSTEAYADILLTGRRATDRICITLSICIKDLDFLYFEDKQSNWNTTSLDKIGGYIGLAKPKAQMLLDPSASVEVGGILALANFT